MIRSKAMERLKYWKNFREPEPPVAKLPVTIHKKPTFDSITSINLRSSYKEITLSQVQSLSNILIREKNKWGFDGHSTINHKYNLKAISGDKVVVDNATGLMWHQNGSNEHMIWNDARDWVKKLNKGGYAGFRDWRLPTLEEASSLLESSKRIGDKYIAPLFSNKQISIWTGDKYGLKGTWVIYFIDGHVGWEYIRNYIFVRPVRSLIRKLEPPVVKSPVTIHKKPAFDNVASINLRSFYKNLSVSQVQSMSNISIRKKNKWGFNGYSTINHKYNLKEISGDKVVVDNVTSLMWHQNGSNEHMIWNDAWDWVKKLNKEGYAGHHDWRLPTLEEASSLLESIEKDSYFGIDRIFSNQQISLWTGDEYDSEGAWSVHIFGYGHVDCSLFHDLIFVRPVRSMNQ